jgi:fructose-1,6-bisphosphatase/inositol monophosphatase family enzyme
VEHRSGLSWTAEAGGGAWEAAPGAPRRRLRASGRTVLDRRTLVLVDHYSAGDLVGRAMALNGRAWVKDFGSSALHGALLASGRADAYLNLRHKAHELGAILLLCREAGGAAVFLDGRDAEKEKVELEGTWPLAAAGSQDLLAAIRASLA